MSVSHTVHFPYNPALLGGRASRQRVGGGGGWSRTVLRTSSSSWPPSQRELSRIQFVYVYGSAARKPTPRVNHASCENVCKTKHRHTNTHTNTRVYWLSVSVCVLFWTYQRAHFPFIIHALIEFHELQLSVLIPAYHLCVHLVPPLSSPFAPRWLCSDVVAVKSPCPQPQPPHHHRFHPPRFSFAIVVRCGVFVLRAILK